MFVVTSVIVAAAAATAVTLLVAIYQCLLSYQLSNCKRQTHMQDGSTWKALTNIRNIDTFKQILRTMYCSIQSGRHTQTQTHTRHGVGYGRQLLICPCNVWLPSLLIFLLILLLFLLHTHTHRQTDTHHRRKKKHGGSIWMFNVSAQNCTSVAVEPTTRSDSVRYHWT